MIFTEKQLLQELFAVPINPQLVAILDGSLKLYSSDALINSYKTSLANNSNTASSFKYLNTMIDKQLLTPAYLSKGLLSYAFSKIFNSGDMKEYGNAFYSPNDNRIFILIDNNTSFGFSSDKWMGRLTIHECMHIACYHGKDNFLKLYHKEYNKFYTIFFHILCNKKLTDKSAKLIANDVDEYIYIFHKAEVHRANLEKAVYLHGSKIFNNIMKKLEFSNQYIPIVQEGYKKLVTLFMNYGIAGIIKSLEDPSCKYILQKLQQTYPVMSNNKAETLAVQELIFPSEIAAVSSELNISKNKIPKAIAMIKVK